MPENYTCLNKDASSAQRLWEAALGELELQMSRANCHTWLQGTRGVNWEGEALIVSVPNIFSREWLEKRLCSVIRKVLISLAGRDIGVRFTFAGSIAPSPAASPTHLNPRYYFVNFVVGDFNRLAFSAAQEVMSHPGKKYNPLVICSDTGLGKTHLLQAMARSSLDKSLSCLYLTAEQFTNQFITSLQERRPHAFTQGFQDLRLLAVDDISFFMGKKQTQESFLHLFSQLYDRDCQLVISASGLPQSLSGLDPRLGSRLGGGLVTTITTPNEQERICLLQHMVAETAPGLNPGVLAVVARRVTGNIRELEGGLNRVLATAAAQGTTPSPELAEAALGGHLPTSPLSPQRVLSAVQDHFHLPADAFHSRKRDIHLSLARQIAIYLLKKETDLSLSQIGSCVGGLAKSSVLSAFRKTEQDLPLSSSLSQTVSQLREQLLSRS